MKKWEVMKAFEEGAAIEYKHTGYEDWQACIEPAWNWGISDYRVKPPKWQPSANGDFYITGDNQIDNYPSEKHVDFGVVFETLDQAKKAQAAFRKYHRAYQLALELNDGWEPEWDSSCTIYYLAYDHVYSDYKIFHDSADFENLNAIYFKDHDTAELAIKRIEAGALE